MNWAKKLLAAGDCPRCGGRLEDLGDGQVSCDTCSYPEPEDGYDEEGNPIEVDEPPRCCDYCGRDIDPDANWMLDTRDGTEHFCCAECQHERAAEIEAAPLCAWCLEKCDQGVVRVGTNPAPFCSTECAKQWSKEHP